MYYKRIALPIATGDASSEALDLTGWRHLAVELPASTMATAPVIGLAGGGTSTGTFWRVTTDATTDFTLSSIVPLHTDVLPRYIKIVSDKTAHSADYTSAIHVVQ